MAKIAMRVDLPEDGEGKFVNVVNPLHLRRKEMKALDKRDDESVEAHDDRFLREIIVGGNLTAEDGRPLKYPLSDEDMDELTNYHFISVSNAFSNAIQGATPKN